MADCFFGGWPYGYILFSGGITYTPWRPFAAKNRFEDISKERAVDYGFGLCLMGNSMLGLCYYLWRQDLRRRGDLK